MAIQLQEPTRLDKLVDPVSFLKEVQSATTAASLADLLAKLPIASEKDFYYDPENPANGWTTGKLHWIPLGKDPGNAGRVRLASKPENPLAERLINAMEATIEMMRLRELLENPNSAIPTSPRNAAQRYFGLPPLSEIAKLPRVHPIRAKALAISKTIKLEVEFDKKAREFSVQIRDHGMGQIPSRIHRTLLSLGMSDKGDKPYLIGVFGQGGSSAYMASKLSWCLSRREPSLAPGDRTIGWTAIKHIYPSGRRDDYFAYLAASPDGQVPFLPAEAADAIGFGHGTLFSHLNYDFSGVGRSAISRTLFPALNHVLYNPVLPVNMVVGGTEATLWGNGYRLSLATAKKKTSEDKVLPVATV